MTRESLFVGGPLDGQRRVVRERRVIQVPVFDPQAFLAAVPVAAEMVPYHVVSYRCAGLWGVGPSECIEIWTPDGVPPSDAEMRRALFGGHSGPPAPSSPAPTSADSYSVSFARMTAEAEAELAAWDTELKALAGRRSR